MESAETFATSSPASGGKLLRALLSLIGIINAVMMATPRIMFALGRDGLFTSKAVEVNKGGTPAFALLLHCAR
jgi:amino acid transporter